MFTSSAVSLLSAPGLTGVFATLITAIVGAGLLVIIVERAKRCLDFTATVFLLHFAITAIIGGFPTAWDWYAVQVCWLAYA
jgi:protein SYS1